MEITVEKIPDVAEHAANVTVNGLPEGVEIMMGLMGASLVLFILFVLPIWLFLHYRSRTKHLSPPPVATPVRADTYEDLAELARLAERIEHRLDAVETLMDAENPRWRR